MSWRKKLQQASFRGVPFLVAAHDADLGRRVQVHEYPLRDKPYAEDLGRKSRTLRVEAYLLGADYMAARDRLLVAVEQAGAGQLEHPYLGKMQAMCLSCQVRESTAEGGMARFALEFVEAGEFTFPTSAASTGAAVETAAEAASSAAETSFTARYAVAGHPGFVAQAAQQIFHDALGAMSAAVGRVRSVAAEVAVLRRDVEAAIRALSDLIYLPGSVAQSLVSNMRQLVRAVSVDVRDALVLAEVFYRFGSLLPPVGATTSSRAAQAANQAAMLQLVQVVALAEGARVAAALEFASLQDAIAVRDALLAPMDELMLAAGLPDELFQALRALRTTIVRDFAARGANLARVVSWTPPVTMPALVVAHLLYADAARADEIVARNRLRHPLFVPGGARIEVLTDAA